ncbi:glutaredoxin family protein [Pseudomonas phage ventosus]|uniref:Glutaredoxin family protein n=1 Tax=Pseudomonas phage ventosus TaxID=2048980 RepID=A0A2H4P822_9CAUD|nr:glutaredoxin family protein [Pseudomonas phage ventosus]
MITIYGKTNCPSCVTAKALLDSKSIGYEYKQLDKDYTVDDLMTVFMEHGVNPRAGLPLVVEDGNVLTLEELKTL